MGINQASLASATLSLEGLVGAEVDVGVGGPGVLQGSQHPVGTVLGSGEVQGWGASA